MVETIYLKVAGGYFVTVGHLIRVKINTTSHTSLSAGLRRKTSLGLLLDACNNDYDNAVGKWWSVDCSRWWWSAAKHYCDMARKVHISNTLAMEIVH